MKRLSFFLFAAIIFILASCGSSNPVDKGIDIMKDATEQLEKASTPEEAINIATQTEAKMKELNLDEKTLSPEEQNKLADAVADYIRAAMTASQLAPSAVPSEGVTSAEVETSSALASDSVTKQ